MTPPARAARWIAHLPPLAKGAVMIGADLVALPLLMMLAYTVRAGSLRVALQGCALVDVAGAFGRSAHAGGNTSVPAVWAG